MNTQEVKYYRTKAAGLLGHKYEDFAWGSLTEFGSQDDTIEETIRKLNNFPSRPPEAKPYERIISPYKDEPQEVLLSVPYWKQTDNYRDANRTCFSSSMAMLIETLLPNELPDDDTYVETVFSIGDTTDPNVQVQALSKHGVQGTYRQDMGFDDLDKELEAGYAVGIAILHRGPLRAPTGGHWLVARGYNKEKTGYYCNDPYGSILDGYQGEVENGKCVLYPRDLLKARWTVEGANSGWGMTCRPKK
jgi:hypothetical protein